MAENTFIELIEFLISFKSLYVQNKNKDSQTFKLGVKLGHLFLPDHLEMKATEDQ